MKTDPKPELVDLPDKGETVLYYTDDREDVALVTDINPDGTVDLAVFHTDLVTPGQMIHPPGKIIWLSNVSPGYDLDAPLDTFSFADAPRARGPRLDKLKEKPTRAEWLAMTPEERDGLKARHLAGLIAEEKAARAKRAAEEAEHAKKEAAAGPAGLPPADTLVGDRGGDPFLPSVSGAPAEVVPEEPVPELSKKEAAAAKKK